MGSPNPGNPGQGAPKSPPSQVDMQRPRWQAPPANIQRYQNVQGGGVRGSGKPGASGGKGASAQPMPVQRPQWTRPMAPLR